MTATPAVRVVALTKTFGSGDRQVRALDGIDLVVEAGTVLGLLGSNGAGKSTLVRILSTLTRPTSGSAEVLGVDVVREPSRVRELIGVTAQHTTLDERLSGAENLQVFARLHRLSAREARERAAHLLRQYDLTDAADRPVSTYSGGMRRRLDIISSLILRPGLLFLDEPTTGLDPGSRRDIWSAVRRVAEEGTSVVLTTQYLEEADRLAARVVVLDRGRVIADGTPSELKSRIGRRLTVTLADPAQIPRGSEVMSMLGVIDPAPTTTPDDGRVVGLVQADRLTLPDVLTALMSADVAVADIGLHEPTLDEAYLALVGARS